MKDLFGNDRLEAEPGRQHERAQAGVIPRLRILHGLLVKYFKDEKQAVEFLRHFAAVDLCIPEGRLVDRFTRDVLIVRAIEREMLELTPGDEESEKKFRESKRRIAELYGVRYKDLSRIYRERAGVTNV